MVEKKTLLDRRTFVSSATLVAVTFGLSMTSPAFIFAAPTSTEKQAEADAVKAKLEELADQYTIAFDNYNIALAAHDEALVNMDAAQERINEAQRAIDEMQGKLSIRANTMYRNGQTSFFDVLFGANSFEEFVSTWDILNELNESDAQLIAEIKVAREEARKAHDDYEAQEIIATEQVALADAAKIEMEDTIAAREAELAALNEEIAELIAAEEAAAKAAAEAALVKVGYVPSGDRGPIPTSDNVLDYAIWALGLPYSQDQNLRHGTQAFDCSGLTWWCYKQVGISIPDLSWTQREGASYTVSVDQANPGDILWRNGHVALYMGGNEYIHAPTFGDVVKVSSGINYFTCALRFD